MNEIIDALEKERRHALLPFFILIAMLVVSLMLVSAGFPYGVIAAAISFAVYAFLYGKFRKRYVAKYKEVAVKAALENEYDELDYEPKRGFPRQYIESLGCIKTGSDYNSEDHFSGKYDGVAFESADVYIADTTTDSHGQSTTDVYFEGRWMVFDYNKRFRSDLMVRQKGFEHAKKSGGLFSSDAPMQKIRMENEMFNYAFITYGKDEHEAFYLLTPPVMDSMLKLREHVKGKMMFCFIENKLHVALCDHRDAFEPPVFRRITEESLKKDVIGEVREVAEFARELKLEKKIWISGGV